MAGLVKLRKMIKIRRLRRRATVDLETASIHIRGRLSDEMPFGAKAMMEDPDVEGVWNSRASTPLQSPVLEPRGSSPSRNPFSRSRRNSSVSSLCHLNSHDDRVSRPSIEPEKILPSNLDGTTTSASPLLNRTPVDTPQQFKLPMVDIQGRTFPRRRSVTIRATSAQVNTTAEPTQSVYLHILLCLLRTLLTVHSAFQKLLHRCKLKTQEPGFNRSHAYDTYSRTPWKILRPVRTTYRPRYG